ncbi:MAG: hypothetical protein J6Q89_08595 [Clostridia bacterium]|nr:hypothetical protein [Clostridia bacterium]
MKLDSIFTSNMVFAAGKPIRIYGEGSGLVEISFAGKSTSFYSDGDIWLVEFEPMEYGGPFELKAVFENETVVLNDIYVGDVYLFAGQSNMMFKLQESTAPESMYETNDMLRLFSTDRIEKSDRFTSKDGWVKSKKDEVGYWSAIAYLTANEVVKTKNVAVGVISAHQGASVIESWLPEGVPASLGISLADNEKHIDHFYEEFKEWNQDGKLYSYALAQVFPFAVSGVVWYQGESDTTIEEANVYDKELSAFIDVVREGFFDSELPFIVIQIADFDNRTDEAWKLLQQKQYDIQFNVPNVKTVISSDVCESDNIHPATKHKLANRVAQVLLGL